jgi:hypothetical protein
MKQSRARKNWVTNTMKTIRDNETCADVGTDLETVTARGKHLESETAGIDSLRLQQEDISEILYAVIRRLNYLYDTTTDEDRREAILDKKARLMLQLILLEGKGDKYPGRKKRSKKESVWEER